MSMIRWGSRLFGLFGLLAALVGGVRAVSVMQPLRYAGLFSRPDGQPCQTACLFGVIPGQTSWEEAIRYLETYAMMRPTGRARTNNHLWVEYGTGDMVVQIRRKHDREPVQTVALHLAALDLTQATHSVGWLSDVVEHFGAPAFVSIGPHHAQHRVLAYPRQGLLIDAHSLSRRRVQMTDRVFKLWLYRQENFDIEWSLHRAMGKTWRGFRSVALYLKAYR